MPAATPPSTSRVSKSEREELLWEALKQHIMTERQKKKEEQEAEVEEERIRKEKEARDRQDAMTLGETREQIQMLNNKIEELRNEKQQLFLKLKKVLNEDDNRKKQQNKKENEFFTMHNVAELEPSQQHPQLFVQQQRILHHQGGKLNAPQVPPVGSSVPLTTPLKRGRSPSPTMQHAANSSFYKTSQPYSQAGKHDDGRRGNEIGRAVLWNKPPNYSPIFYGGQPTTPQPPVPNQQDNRNQPVLFAQKYMTNMSIAPIRTGYHDMVQPIQTNKNVPEVDKQHQRPEIYHVSLDAAAAASVVAQQQQQQSGQQQSLKPHQMERKQIYHIDPMHEERSKAMAAADQQATLHSQPMPDAVAFQAMRGKIPMQPNSGIITQGYTSRGQPIGQPPSSQAQGSLSQQQQIHFARMRY